MSVLIAYGYVMMETISYHDSVFLDLKLSLQFMSLANQIYIPKPALCKAGKLDFGSYQSVLTGQLSNIVVPADAVLCLDVFCQDNSHLTANNSRTYQLISACNFTTSEAIPTTCAHDRRRTRDLSELVEPLRQRSICWHQIWHDRIRQHSDYVADIMHRARADYH
jgi:hypothetical protein